MKHVFMKNLYMVPVFLLASCQLTNDEELTVSTSVDEATLNGVTSMQLTDPEVSYCGEPSTVTFWAGQHIDAGTVTIYNDATNLYVTVNSTEGFQNVSENLKMWAGTDFMYLPVAPNGAPINGQFPYKATVPAGETTYTLTIPLSDLPTYNANNCGVQSLYVVVHGDVLAPNGNGGTSAETAYSGDQEGNSSRWWYYSVYTPQCCVEEPPATGTLETAFIKFDKSGDFGTGYVWTYFKKSNPENYASLNLTRNRWGWAGNVTADGTYSFGIWAGCGLNNTNSGTLVGSGNVTVSGSSVTVEYQMNSGFSLAEVHVYAGDTSPDTFAPGQFGYIAHMGDSVEEYASSHSASFNVEDLNSDGIWLIGHAVVFGEY